MKFFGIRPQMYIEDLSDFDNTGNNVTLTYITCLRHHRNHANTITSVIAAKQTVINEVYVVVFSVKIKISLMQYFIEKYINFIYSADFNERLTYHIFILLL